MPQPLLTRIRYPLNNFIVRTLLCTEADFKDTLEVAFNYNQGEYIGTKILIDYSSVSSFSYELPFESNRSVCNATGGQLVVLEENLERHIKEIFSFSEDYVLTTDFTYQVEQLFFSLSDSNFIDGALNKLDFNEIAISFPNPKRLIVISESVSNEFLNTTEISLLTSLEYLRLDSVPLTNVDFLKTLNKLVNMRKIYFNENNISDVAPLYGLNESIIESIGIRRNPVSDEDVNKLRETFGNAVQFSGY